MKKHFYSHLVEIDTLFISLDLLELQKQEREELVLMIDSCIHHAVIDAILTELADDDKKVFLVHLDNDQHDEIWILLNSKTKNMEQKIKKTAEQLKQRFHDDIRTLKRT